MRKSGGGTAAYGETGRGSAAAYRTLTMKIEDLKFKI